MSGKNKTSKLFLLLQKIGKSFFLPVSILPVAGLLLGIGASFSNPTTISAYNLEWLLGEGSILNAILRIMNSVGSSIFDNLPLIFALAISLGMAKSEKAVAVLSSAIFFIVMHVTINSILILNKSILPDGTLSSKVLDGSIANILGITTLQMGVFGGIIAGLITAYLHNRFYMIKFSPIFGFFSGVRFVPIICSLGAMIVGAISSFIWPIIQIGISFIGNLVMNSGYFGTFIYGLMERALIPFGLHHVFYTPFWYTGIGGTAIVNGTTYYGAQNIFFAQLASQDTTSFHINVARFLSGKYSFMMGGLLGAAFAMYRCSKPEKRKQVGGLLLSAALTSFITGITEPIEFTFLFIAPFLFGIHCVFAGLSFVLMHIFKITIGTTFSCGLIDFILYGVLPGNDKTNWIRLLPILVIYFIVYFFLFKIIIEKFNLKTPGREDDNEDVKLYSKEDYKNKNSNESEDDRSKIIIEGLGGISNITTIDSCITRLRLEVIDTNLINEDKLKKSGSLGIIVKDNSTYVQIIYGTEAPIIKTNLENYINKLEVNI